MRFTDMVGSQADPVEYHLLKPKYAPCRQGGRKGKRKRVDTRRVWHVAVLYRPCGIVAEVGVYDVRCECCKYFQAQVPGVPDRGRYLYEVR
jgi:hypothetical protein